MTSESGRLIGGRYHLREPLGQGGMGVVWLAHDELLDRTVALKEVATNDTTEDVRERMLREARTAARLDHPGAVRIYDVIDEEDHSTAPWIVMEVLSGKSLKDAVNADGPLPPPRVAEIGIALIDALAAAHRAGIVHRDVKPANVQLCEDGRVVLTDFGIASMVGDSSLTRTGDIVGSPAYMSPERAHGRELGPASDLFALGATLYAAVEGTPPFERDTPLATLTAIVNDPPRPCRSAGALAPVLAGLLAKDPEDRLDADEARDLLVAVTRGDDTQNTAAWSPVADPDDTRAMPALAPTPALERPSPPSPPVAEKKPRRWVGALVLLLIIAIVAAGVGTWLAVRHHNNGSPGSSSSNDGPFRPGQGGVPSDWTEHTASAGWSVATPASWHEETQGSVIRYKGQVGNGSGYIAVVTESSSNATSALDAFAASFADGHGSYHEVSRTSTTYRGQQVPVLTFTYVSEGADLEASFQPYAASGHVYILWWQSRATEWDTGQSMRTTVLSTFRAGA